MKKIILLFFFSCTLTIVVAQTPDPTPQKVDYKPGNEVMRTFLEEFPGAKNVKWDTYDEFTVASFSLQNETYRAFFNSDGSLRVIANLITMKQLPGSLAKELSAKYPGFTIAGLYMMNDNGNGTYYAELEKEGKKTILNSSGKKWTVVTKTKAFH